MVVKRWTSGVCIVTPYNQSLYVVAHVSEYQTNFSILVSKLDAQRVHGSEDGCQALDGVAVHNRLVLLHIVPRETVFVDDPARAHRH